MEKVESGLSVVGFYTDIHEYAPNIINCPIIPGPNKVYVGDNIDLANVAKDQVGSAEKRLKGLAEKEWLLWKNGNHERQKDSDTLSKLTDAIGCMHGDGIFWDKKKSDKYRSKDHGAGFLKRKLWVNALESLENGWDRAVSKSDLERFYQHCLSNGVNCIIVGHLHPKKLLNIKYKGMTLIVLPRGYTELDIESLHKQVLIDFVSYKMAA